MWKGTQNLQPDSQDAIIMSVQNAKIQKSIHEWFDCVQRMILQYNKQVFIPEVWIFK